MQIKSNDIFLSVIVAKIKTIYIFSGYKCEKKDANIQNNLPASNFVDFYIQ